MIEQEIKKRITWEIPARLNTPHQISVLLQNKNNSRFTSLEWAIFLKQVLFKSNIQVQLAQVEKINDDYSRHPLEIGNYVLVLPERYSDGKKAQAFFSPTGLSPDSISEFSILTSRQTIARFMALKALSLLKIKDRFNFLLPFAAEPGDVNSKLVLKLLNTAFELDPESKEVKAAYFWSFTQLQIFREARKWLKRLEASSEHPGIKELRAIAKITKNDLQAALGELENPSQPFQRLYFYLKLMNGKETSRKRVRKLSKEDNEFSSYLAAMYFLKNDKKQAQAYLEKIIKQKPDSSWAVHLLFTALLNSGNFAEARKLIPKVAVLLQKRENKKMNLKDIKKNLENKIDMLEEEKRNQASKELGKTGTEGNKANSKQD
ncbi:MAG: tetratricopeptide repeat protein [Myxococcota bacterium]